MGISAADIAEKADVSPSTVYRNVEKLADLGIAEINEDKYRSTFALKMDHPVTQAFDHLYSAILETYEGPWDHEYSLFKDYEE